jgi:threonine dehydrogenase-like Zn-dependent dehydrogenase
VKAVVYHGPRHVSVDEVPDAKVEKPTDALVRITAGTGQCPVKRYNRYLRSLIAEDKVKPSWIVSHDLPLDQAPEAYKHFDAREEGWTKVVLHPGQAA